MENHRSVSQGKRYHVADYCLSKDAWSDASRDLLAESIREILGILRVCLKAGCNGAMIACEQKQQGEQVQTKLRCEKCGSIQYAATGEA